MLRTYDMSLFGSKLKEIRKSAGFTQLEVYRLSHVHEDTLRRLENGQSIPSFETVEKLSLIYNTDLLNILSSCVDNISLEKVYSEIDNLLLGLHEVDDIRCLEEINNCLNIFVMKGKGFNYIQVDTYEQTKNFIELLVLYINRRDNNKSEIIEKFEECFNIINNKILNHIQLRILLIISVLKLDLSLYEESNIILFKIKKHLESKITLTSDEKKIYIKCIGNISYNYHEMEDHDKALAFAEEGILFCRENETIYHLYLLYGRKAVAKYFLNHEGFIDDARNSICILDILGYTEMKNQYIKIYKKNYNITIY